jgi:hypothetical protein
VAKLKFSLTFYLILALTRKLLKLSKLSHSHSESRKERERKAPQMESTYSSMIRQKKLKKKVFPQIEGYTFYILPTSDLNLPCMRHT